MYFNGGLIPYYLVLRNLHLLNSFAVYIVPALLGFFNVIIFINFYNSLPDALEEAAKIDGANDLQIFIRIILPLSRPILATMALFIGVNHWNSWFDSAYFIINKPNLMTIQHILYTIVSQTKGITLAATYFSREAPNINILHAIKYATMAVSILPVACIYPFLQRYFIKGMMVGSIKE
jgi:putative aldouronate transport system permease protein